MRRIKLLSVIHSLVVIAGLCATTVGAAPTTLPRSSNPPESRASEPPVLLMLTAASSHAGRAGIDRVDNSVEGSEDKPCDKPPHRQFDFWVGEWDVFANGKPAGTNSIQRILDGCVIFENWTGAGGGAGKSFNFYNRQKGKWQQIWIDNRGGVLEFAGEFKDGALHYEAESLAPNGSRIMHRLIFTRVAEDRVRQLWEQSRDDGKSWTVAFDGDYRRKH
jgi:hypothetical protein